MLDRENEEHWNAIKASYPDAWEQLASIECGRR